MIHKDLRHIILDSGLYDLVILGDVLEHVNRDEAIWFWGKVKYSCKFIWLSLPVKKFKPWYRGYNQPSIDYRDNPNEEHKYDWNYHEIIGELGPFVWQVPFKVIVVLIAEGNL